MSSKHPLTTESDTVTLGKGGSGSPNHDYFSESGEPTLVDWKRRPYEPHASHQLGASVNTTVPVGTGVTGGVTNRCALEKKPVDDLEFDANPSATYQSLTDLSAGHGARLSGNSEKKDFRRGRPPHTRRFLCFLGFIAPLALLVACIGVGMSCYVVFVHNPQPRDDTRITELETQLSSSQKMIDRLTSMVEELRQNVSERMNTRDTDIQQLEQQVNELSQAVDELRNQSTTVTGTTATTAPDVPVTPALTVNISGNCAYEIKTCRVTTDLLTPVDDAALGSLPNYGSCDTLHLNLTETDTYVQDVYCAITNTRGERNPIMATLIHNEETDSVWCQCYVTALETRIGVVMCGLFVRRCPSIVQVE